MTARKTKRPFRLAAILPCRRHCVVVFPTAVFSARPDETAAAGRDHSGSQRLDLRKIKELYEKNEGDVDKRKANANS